MTDTDTETSPTLDSIQCGADWLWTCPQCGALMLNTRTGLHFDWHERLRRAVDESEMLD